MKNATLTENKTAIEVLNELSHFINYHNVLNILSYQYIWTFGVLTPNCILRQTALGCILYNYDDSMENQNVSLVCCSTSVC